MLSIHEATYGAPFPLPIVAHLLMKSGEKICFNELLLSSCCSQGVLLLSRSFFIQKSERHESHLERASRVAISHFSGLFISGLIRKADPEKTLKLSLFAGALGALFEMTYAHFYEKEKKRAIESLQKKSCTFSKLSHDFQRETEVAITAVSLRPETLEALSKELRDDYKVVIAAVGSKGWTLRFTLPFHCF